MKKLSLTNCRGLLAGSSWQEIIADNLADYRVSCMEDNLLRSLLEGEADLEYLDLSSLDSPLFLRNELLINKICLLKIRFTFSFLFLSTLLIFTKFNSNCYLKSSIIELYLLFSRTRICLQRSFNLT